jgi:hypothetical protein
MWMYGECVYVHMHVHTHEHTSVQLWLCVRALTYHVRFELPVTAVVASQSIFGRLTVVSQPEVTAAYTPRGQAPVTAVVAPQR